MIKEIKKFHISICDASKGGIGNLPLVNIKDIEGFDTDTYFKHIGQNRIRASIDIILSTSNNRYFVEFKSGDYCNIDVDNLMDKISFTMLKYFGDGDESIFDSKIKNYFYLVIKGEDELYLGLNMSSMQSYTENPSKISLDSLNKVIEKFEGFCYKKAEILTASRFLNKIIAINNKCSFAIDYFS